MPNIYKAYVSTHTRIVFTFINGLLSHTLETNPTHAWATFTLMWVIFRLAHWFHSHSCMHLFPLTHWVYSHSHMGHIPTQMWYNSYIILPLEKLTRLGFNNIYLLVYILFSFYIFHCIILCIFYFMHFMYSMARILHYIK